MSGYVHIPGKNGQSGQYVKAPANGGYVNVPGSGYVNVSAKGGYVNVPGSGYVKFPGKK